MVVLLQRLESKLAPFKTATVAEPRKHDVATA